MLDIQVPNWIFDFFIILLLLFIVLLLLFYYHYFSETDWQADMRVYISVDGAGIYTTNKYVRVCIHTLTANNALCDSQTAAY